MTKRELLTLLLDLPDDAEIYVESWPEDTVPARGPQMGDLYAVARVSVHEDAGPDAPAFANIAAKVAFIV